MCKPWKLKIIQIIKNNCVLCHIESTSKSRTNRILETWYRHTQLRSVRCRQRRISAWERPSRTCCWLTACSALCQARPTACCRSSRSSPGTSWSPGGAWPTWPAGSPPPLPSPGDSDTTELCSSQLIHQQGQNVLKLLKIGFSRFCSSRDMR